MICFGSDSVSGSDFYEEVLAPTPDLAPISGFGNAGLRLERVARLTRIVFVKLRRYIKFLENELM
jgi:hypothetical protein